jgi:hypothetical protein
MTEDLKNSQELSKESKNSFIELIVPESPQRNDDMSSNNFPSSDSSSHKSLLSTNSIEPTESLRPANSKLSAISLTFNHNISLSITGDIKSSSLIKILAALEEELEEKLEEKEGKSC